MQLIDWILVCFPLLLLLFVALYTRTYMKGVADFLSGGKLAGRYLPAVAKGEQGVGAVVFVAMFELISKSGFILTWWGWLSVPVCIVQYFPQRGSRPVGAVRGACAAFARARREMSGSNMPTWQ